MNFICQLLEPIDGEVIIFKTNQLKGVWLKMFNDIFTHGREPHMVVQPTVAGIYVLERII